MESSNNVIQFPKTKRNSPPQSMDDVYDAVSQARVDHVDLILPYITEYLVARLCDEGFDIGQPECREALALVEVAIRGVMYKSVGLYHPLADLADEIIVAAEEPEEDEDDSD